MGTNKVSTTPGSNVEWPASNDALERAREFLKECANVNLPTLLLPDKDADGLCASLIIHRTLTALGLSSELIFVHFVTKGSNVHAPSEQPKLESYNAKYLLVVDQGSRSGGPLIRDQDAKTLIVDHHWTPGQPEDYPQGALVLSAAHHPPVATSSMLAYILCRTLLPATRMEEIDYLGAMGTFGDLGTSFSFLPAPPWPKEEMQSCVRRCTKKALGEAVGLLNAPRRTATYDVASAWQALFQTKTTPHGILTSSRLHAARAEVSAETSRVARNRPYFSSDGRIALVRVTSGAQVHPVLAQRWASSLKSMKLEVVMCANDGYLPGMTNFSCRVAKCAKGRGGREVNIIEILKEYAGRSVGLTEAMGDDFARGHKEASGGIVLPAHFEQLWAAMQAPIDGEATAQTESPRKKRKTNSDSFSNQKNTLDSWVKHL